MDFRGGQPGFGKEKIHLGLGKLFALGPEEAEVQELDLLFLEFEELGQLRHGGLLVQNILANLIRKCFERDHLIPLAYT